MTARETDAFEMAGSPFFWDSMEQVGCFVIIADYSFYDSGDSAQIAVDLEDTGRVQVKQADGSEIFDQGCVMVKELLWRS